MELLDDWGKWKQALGKAADLGETVGLSDKTISNAAENIGTFLSNHVDPHNREERLLKELWDAADTKDREVLSKLVVRICDK